MNVRKPIALVTCYFQKNYGSQLQAFATQMAFDKMGLPNATVRIDGLLCEINRAKYRYFLSRMFCLSTVRDKLATVRKYMARRRNATYARNLGARYGMFDDFANTQFKLTRVYDSRADLGADARNYAAFVVGSDQLWLPSNIAADYYTLNFVPDHVPKIALATSFGVSSLPKKYGKLAGRFLRRIDHLSVRESSGQLLVRQWAGRDVPVVCDPTLLFTASEWVEMLGVREKGARFADGQKYIFVYFLGNNPWQRQLVRRVAAACQQPVVQLAHVDDYVASDEGFADYTPYAVGPREFVELIHDAEFVFTDSFHCTVFSMIFHKLFYTFPRYTDDGPASTNGRLYSLLHLVGHEHRMVRRADAADFALGREIDFEGIDTRLQQLRSFTWNWLRQASFEETDAGV